MNACTVVPVITNCFTYATANTCEKCKTGYGLNAAKACVECVVATGATYDFTDAVSCDWDATLNSNAGGPAGICQNGLAATSGTPCGSASQTVAALANCALAFQTGALGNTWKCTQCATDYYFETMGTCSQGTPAAQKCHWTC